MILIFIWLVCRLCTTLHTKCCCADGSSLYGHLVTDTRKDGDGDGDGGGDGDGDGGGDGDGDAHPHLNVIFR